MSDYALAAVSVKPLSFNMIPVLEDINFGKVATISADKVNKVIDKVSDRLKAGFSIPGTDMVLDIKITSHSNT